MLTKVVLLAPEIVTAAYSVEVETEVELITPKIWKEFEEVAALLVSEVRGRVSVLIMVLCSVVVSESVAYFVEVSPLGTAYRCSADH